MSTARKLGELLHRSDLLVLPVICDPLSARLAQLAGLPAALLGGFAVSAVRLGLPDTGLITFAEMLDHVRNTCAAVPGFPVVADGDTGYGNAMNVRRTVVEYARAGAACITIEDQIWPKKCGHYAAARRVIARDEARMKIRAAVEARRAAGVDILIMARTDARGAMGFDEAVARCRDFEAEGADVLFAEALQSKAELNEFAGSFKTPTWANMMPKTPLVSRAELRAMGYRVVTYNLVLGASIRAMREMVEAIAADDVNRVAAPASFEEITALVGLPEFNAIEARYTLPE